MDVRSDQIPVSEVDTGRRHRSGDHSLGFAVEILVVGAASRAVGEHQCGLSPATRPPAALRVVRRRGRDVAQVDEVQLSDVDPELHRRRAEQKRQIPLPKTRLPFLALLGHHLRRVLTRFKHALQFHEIAIALDEVAVHLRGAVCLLRAGECDPGGGPRRHPATSAARRG